MDANRRQLLRGCGAGTLGALTAPAWAWADRIRALGEPTEVDRPAWGGQVSPDFQRWMGAARVRGARLAIPDGQLSSHLRGRQGQGSPA